MRQGIARAAGLLGFVASALGGLSCTGSNASHTDPLAEARRRAEGSKDGEVVGRWLMAELVAEGGSAIQATAARKALDAIQPRPKSLYASLSRGVDDEAHGRFLSAADDFVDALDAARTSDEPETSILGWYAAHHLLRLRPSVPHLWDRAKPVVERALDRPGHLGFRARGELVDLWITGDKGLQDTPIAEAAKKLGCADHARLAGPFGRLAPGDSMRAFEAEAPGP